MGKETRDQPPGPLSHVGEALRILRESKGVSRSALATRVEIDPSALSRYESGASGMWVATLGRILIGLNCDVADLRWALEENRRRHRGVAEPSEDRRLSRPLDPSRDESIIITSLVDKLRHLGIQLAELSRECDSLRRERDDLLKSLR